jgi:hypothetical protein
LPNAFRAVNDTLPFLCLRSAELGRLAFWAKSGTTELATAWWAPKLREFLHHMGREAKQGAVGLVIDRDYLEIGFPLEETPSRRPKGRKRGGK